MDMDGWRDILHFDFHGEHVLVSGLRLSSAFDFIVASLLTVVLCALEKYLSYLLLPKFDFLHHRQRSPFRNALRKAAMYWVLTLTRLLYMLLAMTFHVGLIVVAVTTLTLGQFIIDYSDALTGESTGKGALHIEDAPLLRRNNIGVTSDEYFALTPEDPNSTIAETYPPRPSQPAATAQDQAHRRQVSSNARADAPVFTLDDVDET